VLKYDVPYETTGVDEVLILNPETVLEIVAQAGAGNGWVVGSKPLLIFVSVHVYEFGHLFASLP
jgi:hypothetical protein